MATHSIHSMDRRIWVCLRFTIPGPAHLPSTTHTTPVQALRIRCPRPSMHLAPRPSMHPAPRPSMYLAPTVHREQVHLIILPILICFHRISFYRNLRCPGAWAWTASLSRTKAITAVLVKVLLGPIYLFTTFPMI
jgi:hypothetical protein